MASAQLASTTLARKGHCWTCQALAPGAITDPEAEFLRQFAHQIAGDDGGDGDDDEDDDAPVGQVSNLPVK